MSFKVIFTDYDYPSIDIEREVLSEIDCEIVELQTKDESRLANELTDADAVIVEYSPITSKVISNMQKCKVIARYGIGVDMIDLSAATAKNIPVCNVPDYCLDEVADHAMALILSLNRKIIKLNDSVKNGIWDVFSVGKPIYRLASQVLGLVGFGKIPQNLYIKAKPLFGKIIAYDPYLSQETINKFNLSIVTFYQLIRTSDYISIHCPLVEETKHLFRESQFQLMKPTSYIINTSRGSIINTTALYNALINKQIAGAALDVLEQEPPGMNNALLKLDNTIITPHASFYSESSIIELKRKAALAVLKVLKGENPINVVNKL